MPEYNVDWFIRYKPVIDENELNKVKKKVADVNNEMDKVGKTWSGGRPRANKQIKDITQSIQQQLKVLKEFNKIDKSGVMGQSTRLRIIKDLVNAKAQGVDLDKLTLDNGKKLNEVLKETHQEYQQIGAAGKKSLLTILRWAIGWTAVYGVIRKVRQLIGEISQDYLDMEEQIYRAISASRLTRGGGIPAGADVEKLKSIYTSELLSYIHETTAGFKQSGEALYFLSTAGFTAKESLSALKPVLDLSIGAFGQLQEIARLTASIYNVFGKQMGENLTTQEKMRHIADVLAYTYRNNQVELSEIATAMQYSSQMAGLLNVKFETLVGTVGFLGTGMLRGSKAGTSLFNSFLQIANKSDILRDKLGLVFDPSKPLDFVDIMTQLHKKFGDGALTLDQLNVLFSVFGRRGGRAVAEILNRWDDWLKTIKQTNTEIDGTAEKMRELVEESTKRKFMRFWNIFKTNIIDSFAPFIDDLRIVLDFINNQLGKGAFEFRTKVNAEMRKLKREGFADIFGDLMDTTLEKWAKVRVITNQWVDDLVKSKKINEDIADAVKEQVEARLTSLMYERRSKGIFGVPDYKELGKIFWETVNNVQKVNQAKKEDNKTTEESEKVNYALLNSFKDLNKEIKLQQLQYSGLTGYQLKQRQIITELSTAYNKLKADIESSGKNLPLPSFDKFVSKIYQIAELSKTSPEQATKALAQWQKELGTTVMKNEDLFKIIKLITALPYEQTIDKWRETTREYKNAVADLNNDLRIQTAILKASGVSDVEIAKLKLSYIDKQISLQQDYINQLKKTQPLNTQAIKQEEDKLKQLQRQKALQETEVGVAVIRERKRLNESLYNDLDRLTEQYYKKERIEAEISGKTRIELQEIEINRINALIGNKQRQLEISENLSDEEKRRIQNTIQNLKYSKEIATLQKKLLEIEEKREKTRRELSAYQSILQAQGYTDYDIATKMLEIIKERNDLTKEEIETLTEQWKLKQQIAQLDERERDIKRQIQEIDLMTGEKTGVLGVFNLEREKQLLIEMRDKAQEMGDIQTYNTAQQELENLEWQEKVNLMNTAKDMADQISESIYDVIVNSKSWGDVMRSINKTVLAMALKILEEMVLKTLLWRALLGISGALFGGGGAEELPALSTARSAAMATVPAMQGGGVLPSYPEEIPIVAHKKEMVLPSNISEFIIKSAQQATGKTAQQQSVQPITVVNVVDQSFVPSALAQNPNVVVNLINEDLLRNGSTRKTIYRSFGGV